MKLSIVIPTFAVTIMIAGCTAPQQKRESPLASKIRRFVPTTIQADVSGLSGGNRKALQKLVEAAQVMDKLYARQIWSGYESLRTRLEADTSAEGKECMHYFRINCGPWSKLDRDEPFIDGAPAVKPEGANYYPEDMTKEEFNSWLATIKPADQKLATGFYTVIQRGPDRTLTVVPYDQEYRQLLVPAAALLREAAELTDNTSLKKFLTLRADAFLSNDYYASDVAWMDLDSPIEPTIGPYEVYMDEMFNYKAAFEAFICLRDDTESARLARFAAHLQEIENHLPIDARYRNPKLGALAPIRVVDEVMTGGEAKAGVQSAAYNLPNDERVTSEKGSKRVMLKNVQEAKFKAILVPIAAIAVDPSQQTMVSFEPFFTFILAHELMHGLGPHSIIVGGKATTARQALRELSSAFEEAKADISGLFALQYLIDTGVIDRSMEQKFYVTYLAGVFRSIRFGLNDAHGKGMALQFNYLLDHGAIVYNASAGWFSADPEKFKTAARDLTGEIMTVQAEGSYDKAKAMLDKYAVIRPEMQKTIDALKDLPVDIEPIFTPVQ